MTGSNEVNSDLPVLYCLWSYCMNCLHYRQFSFSIVSLEIHWKEIFKVERFCSIGLNVQYEKKEGIKQQFVQTARNNQHKP